MSALNYPTSYRSGFARSAVESRWPSFWRGMLHAWTFSLGQTGNNVFDYGSERKDTTLTSLGVDSWKRVVNGGPPSSLEFNGANDRVDVTTEVLEGFSRFTVACWANPKSSGEGGFGRFVEKDGTNCFTFFVRSDLSFRAVLRLSGGDVTLTSSASIVETNQWQHFAVAYDGSTARLFYNGLQLTSSAASGTLGTTSLPLTIGNNGSTELRTFDGNIGSVNIWNQSRSNRTIAALARYPNILFYRKPVIPFSPAVAPSAVVGRGLNRSKKLNRLSLVG